MIYPILKAFTHIPTVTKACIALSEPCPRSEGRFALRILFQMKSHGPIRTRYVVCSTIL